MKSNRLILLAAILVIAVFAFGEDKSKNRDWSAVKGVTIGRVLTDASVLQGELKTGAEPDYPADAKSKGLQGLVVLAFTTDKKGKIKDISIVSGDPILSKAAVKAVRQWRYAPANAQGNPFPSEKRVTFNFVLREGVWDCNGGRPILETAESAVRSEWEHSYKVGKGVTAPKPLHTPEPEFSEKAREQRLSGRLVLGALVGSGGDVRSVKQLKELGLGLDEKAIEAVCTWRFSPAMKDGQAVPVLISVDVTFWLP